VAEVVSVWTGCVAIHWPPQVSVCVQKEALGQSFAPTTQGMEGSAAVVVGGRVLIQAPPQGPDVGQVIVGVQNDPDGQPGLFTVQGIWVTGVGDAIQRPPQVSVCVQIDPEGHIPPPRMHDVTGWDGCVEIHRPPQVSV
jgi:hypothetical protein